MTDFSSTMQNLQMPKANLSARAAAMVNDPKNRKSVHEAAVKFEAMYMNEMMNHMFAGLEVDENFGGGKGEEIFRSLLVEQYGNMVAKSGQTGIAENLEREMLRMQEAQLNPRGL